MLAGLNFRNIGLAHESLSKNQRLFDCIGALEYSPIGDNPDKTTQG